MKNVNEELQTPPQLTQEKLYIMFPKLTIAVGGKVCGICLISLVGHYLLKRYPEWLFLFKY